jgi:hypothetical protein
MTWTDWAVGVLNGIGAPINTTNIEALWAWSGSESGTADRMRWNNPLNTTLPWLSPPSHPMNSVGVQFFMDVPSGIAATVATLVNGYYPTILSHLRNSVPRAQWGDACHELGVWGTGCAWLTPTYGPAPGVLQGGFGNLTDQEINDQFNFLSQKLSTVGGALQTDIAAVKAQVAAMPASNPVDLAATNSAISVLNAKLDAIAARLQKDLA